QPVQSRFRDDFSTVSFYPLPLTVDQEVRIIIMTLSGQHHGKIEALGQTIEVDLAYHRRLVTITLQQLWEIILVPVKRLDIVHLTVHKAVHTGQEHRAAGRTDGVGDKPPGKQGAVTGDPIDVGCPV